MTDEAHKAGKAVKAALVLFALLLPALALLAGCESGPQKASFLRAVNDEVAFVEWTKEGIQISGTIDILERKPNNEIKTTKVTFGGHSDGKDVIVKKSSWALHGSGKVMTGGITGLLS